MGSGSARPGLFVVQKHAASRLHWDFRLEMGGTLRSWAVPKGPSLDPAEKRLAVEVEDHPIEYADFEGTIPDGNYGAGAVIVWDSGQWIAHEDPVAGYAAGKLLFELRGHKLGGVWTLVRTKRNPKEWLLIKKPDSHATTTAPAETSIFSGRTVEEVAARASAAPAITAALQKLGAPKKLVRAMDVELMLAETSDRPFDDPAWVFELKYDGYRLLAERVGGRARLVYRRGLDVTELYPDIAVAVAALPADCVLDGELCVLAADGYADFHRLQRRAQLHRERDIARAAVELPASLMVFDLLGFGGAEGFDVRPLPLVARKELLGRLVPRIGRLRWVDHIATHGSAMYAEVARRGWHGIMAKRVDAPYRAGRSSSWKKLKVDLTSDFVVVGWSGERTALGALHLAAFDDKGVLTYAGAVGSGIRPSEASAILEKLAPLDRTTAPCTGSEAAYIGRSVREVSWVDPHLVVEIRYHQLTDIGLVRHAVFLRFRADKAPSECTLAQARGTAAHAEIDAEPDAENGDEPDRENEPAPDLADPDLAPEAAEPASSATPSAARVVVSNRDKVFFPENGLTKGNLVDFYREIAPLMLPYLRDRPLVLTRFPDGIHGKSFFQQDAPVFTPGWIRTIPARAEVGKPKETRHILCNDVDTLAWVANLGAIPLHVWASRAPTLERPDWCILDLDPKGAPFAHVVAVARAIHDLCDAIQLPAFAKTSGSSGLHVLIPTGGQCTHEQSRMLAQIIAQVIVERLPEIATITRVIADRGGRVYIDFGQNGLGKLLVAPYSVRPLPGAPVSTPLEWSEVDARLSAQQYTITNLGERVRRWKGDPLAPILSASPDLGAALGRLMVLGQKQ